MWFCVSLEPGRDASIDAAIRRSREQGLSDARRLTGDRRMPATGASSTPPPTGPLKGKKGPGPLCFEPYCDPRLDPFPYSANHTVSDGRKHPPAVLGLPDAWGNLLASPRRRRVAFTRQRGRSLRARRLLRLSSQKGTPIKAVTIVSSSWGSSLGAREQSAYSGAAPRSYTTKSGCENAGRTWDRISGVCM